MQRISKVSRFSIHDKRTNVTRQAAAAHAHTPGSKSLYKSNKAARSPTGATDGSTKEGSLARRARAARCNGCDLPAREDPQAHAAPGLPAPSSNPGLRARGRGGGDGPHRGRLLGGGSRLKGGSCRRTGGGSLRRDGRGGSRRQRHGDAELLGGRGRLCGGGEGGGGEVRTETKVRLLLTRTEREREREKRGRLPVASCQQLLPVASCDVREPR